MDCVAGRVLWDPSLQALDQADRRAVYEDMNRVIAALHRVDYRAVGLADLWQAGQLLRPPDCALDQAIPRLGDRADRGHGPADRLAAGEHPRRGRDRDRPWRLSARQPDFSSHRAAHRRGPRLGAFHARPSARRFLVSLHELAYSARAVSRPGRPRSRLRSAYRPSAITSPPTVAVPGASRSTRATGISISPTTCSAPPASPRASWVAWSMGPRQASMPLEVGRWARVMSELGWQQVERIMARR